LGRPLVKRFAYAIRPLSVCPVVGVGYCGLMVGWIKMKLGMHVSLGPGYIVLDRDSALPPPKGHNPQFAAHICCGQMAGWIKMSLGTEEGVRLCVRWEPSSPAQKGAEPSPPIFGPCLLWPNVCMDQHGTWHGGGPRSRPHCARWGPSSSPKRGG